MKKVHIESLNKTILFDTSIKCLKFNNQLNYKEISLNLINEIIFSINDSTVDLEKYGLIIYNPFQISLNDKKIITAMYKELEKNCHNENNIALIQQIESKSFELFNNLLLDFDYTFEYNEEIDLIKLFSSFNLKFPEVEYSNYVELLTNYIKLNSIFNKSKIVVSFGTLSLLSKEELILFEKELAYNDIVMLDISFVGDRIIENKDLVIDEDWCII